MQNTKYRPEKRAGVALSCTVIGRARCILILSELQLVYERALLNVAGSKHRIYDNCRRESRGQRDCKNEFVVQRRI